MNEELNLKPKQEKILTEQEKNIQEVFKLCPELEKIGNQEQYGKYLETIFPESKVKQILWHGTQGDWFKKEKFDQEKIGSSTENITNRLGFYFSSNRKIADLFRRGIKFVMGEGFVFPADTHTFPVVISLQDPMFISAEKFEKSAKENKIPPELENLTGDGIIIEKYKTTEQLHPEFMSDNLVIYSKDQVHVLGSKFDIEAFQEFVGDKTT